jgi:tight adherence protein C
VTRAEALAAVAGLTAAAGIVELAGSRRARRRRDRGAVRRAARALGHGRGAARADALGQRRGAGHRSTGGRAGHIESAAYRSPGGLAARAEAAGLRAGAGEIMLAKLAAAPAAALAVLTLAPPTPGRLGMLLLVAAPTAGFFAPDLWLRGRARARARRMEAEQADVLDLLRVAVGAGLSAWRALGEVGRRHPGVLAAELGAAARCVALGVPADAALARLERRCPAAGTHALTSALRRADRLGAPPGRALAALAAEARARQARRAAEQAARAAPKIQLVVALLLVPSVLLMVAAALVPALTGASL